MQTETCVKYLKEIMIYVVCISCVPLTVCDSLPATRHDAVTQLDDLGDADNLL